MNDLVKTEDMSINLPSIGVGKINQPALAKVNAGLPELEEKTRYFGGQNSQSSLTMMSLTMLNGHAEVSGYIAFINTKLAEGVIPHGNDLEEFLDRMAEKYTPGVDETMMRIFGTTDISDTDFMTKMAQNS